jgi:hypothetical protein
VLWRYGWPSSGLGYPEATPNAASYAGPHAGSLCRPLNLVTETTMHEGPWADMEKGTPQGQPIGVHEVAAKGSCAQS